ncbi:MAG: FixH family protein [Hyphomonas sp.]|nr:FixH family protein [Hyphomonas sp.]
MTATATSKSGFTLKGWHVLLMMVAFFGFMFVVNGIFLWASITSFPGEDEQKSYLQGLNYNDTIEARRISAEAGWQAQAGLVGAGETQALLVRLFDAEGNPLAAEAVTAQIRRTATDGADIALTVERTAAGEYTARVGDLSNGLWEARIEADIPNEDGTTPFVVKKSLIVE